MGFMNSILKNEKQDPEFWYRQGHELCTNGYYLDALEALDKMLVKSAYHADSWFLKGYALYQMGKYEESMQFFDQALSCNPCLHEALTYKGLIYSGFGRHSEALVQYERALAINPRYGKAWYVKGLTLAIIERYDEAINAYEQVLGLEPKHGDALAGISIAMKKRERSRVTKPVEKSSSVFSAAPVMEIPETSAPFVTSASPQTAKPVPLHNLFPPSPVVLQKKIAFDPYQPIIIIDKNQTVAFSEELNDSVKTKPTPHRHFNSQMQVDTCITASPPMTPIRRNSYDELISQTLKILINTPDDSGSLNNLGDLYIKVGKYQLATEAYEKALELEPEHARAWTSLGDARRKLGIYDEAQFAYDRALEINSDDIPTWMNRAKVLAMQGKFEEAIDSCDCAIERDNANIDAWLYKGFILKKIQRHSDALHAYDHVLTINPHHDHAIRQRKTLINIP
jgi:tetratricopeptide (TPR) repeat protein